jgi:hypothetical protein
MLSAMIYWGSGLSDLTHFAAQIIDGSLCLRACMLFLRSHLLNKVPRVVCVHVLSQVFHRQQAQHKPVAA